MLFRSVAVVLFCTLLITGVLAFCTSGALALGGNSAVSISAVVSSTTPAVKQAPSVELRGFAAPNARLVVKRGDVEIATGTANADGTFLITLTDQPTGQQIYTVYAYDASGNPLAPITFSFTLSEGTATIVAGIFPGPSITIDQPAVKIGQAVSLSGATVPNSTVTVTVHSAVTQTLTTIADALGQWLQSIDTKNLEPGTHTAQAKAVTPSNTISSESASVEFTINPLEKCDGKKTADLNCDGSVNLTDFSILLFYWKKVDPANERADINNDGIVSIVDFSIMLYQWTG